MDKTLRFTTNRTARAETRTETADGRDYLVAPVVAVREQVLNGLLTTGGEIAANLEAWENIPLVLEHPLDDAGEFVSASAPGIWERQGIGYLRNVRWDGRALHGEMWFDVERMTALGGDAAAALARIRNGEMVEVSTGYFADFEESSGVFNGDRFVGIVHNIQPDHLALLPNEVGACSIRDGCGVPRINQALCANCEKRPSCGCQSAPVANADPLDDYIRTGIMVALYVPGDIASSLAVNAADLPPGSTAVPPDELHLTLGYLGKTTDTKINQLMLLEQVSSFARHMAIVQGEIGGIGRFNNQEDGDANALYASFDCGYLPQFRQELFWRLAEAGAAPKTDHGFTPHITLAYIPASAATPNILPERQPVAFSFITVAWGDEITHFPLQGIPGDAPQPEQTAVAMNHKETVMNTEEEVLTNEQDEFEPLDTAVAEEPEQPETAVAPEPEPEPVANEEAEAPAPEPEPEPVEELVPLSQVQGLIDAALAPFKEALGTIQANAQRQREQVINQILAAPNVAFTRDELTKADDLFLNRLAQTLQVPDYSAQGNGRMQANAAQEDEWTVIETPAGWETL